MNISSYQIDVPPLWRRRLVEFAAVLFCVSTLFPIIASVVPAGGLPAWIGITDVVLAFVVMILGLAILSIAGNKIQNLDMQASYQVYRALGTMPLILLVLFFVAGDRLLWNVLLPGLAWRIWLLVYTLPAGLTLWRTKLYAKTN
jgi:hypothetical protein